MPQNSSSGAHASGPPDNHGGQLYELELYVAGISLRSQQIIAELTALCERVLCGRYTLAIVDVYQQPTRASAAGIVAVPALVRIAPLPALRFVVTLEDLGYALRQMTVALD